jgi:hypothetical protein
MNALRVGEAAPNFLRLNVQSHNRNENRRLNGSNVGGKKVSHSS